ncbi:MAG: hypothetical protein HY348_10100 [Nitrospira defluvii]|nr:hypothetical protein [Nitrospira defluvii]
MGIPFVGPYRLKFLAERALAEAWDQARKLGDASDLGPTGLIIGVPESVRPGYCFPEREYDLQKWLSLLGIKQVGPIEIISAGHCNGQVGLARAAEYIAAGAVNSCLIGAADTQLQLKVLRWHENHLRLKCAYLNDGLIPGEAAGFLVVEEEGRARRRGARILARVLASSFEREEAIVLSDRPNTSAALTSTVRKTLLDAKIRLDSLDSVWCDLNGESYRAREWAYSEVRLGLPSSIKLFHPADCYGDLGAASDLALLGLATLSHALGWFEKSPSLVFAGSEAGIRGATILCPLNPPESDSLSLRLTEGLPQTYHYLPDIPELATDNVNFELEEDPLSKYFDWQLRQEHLDEITSLYYQRNAVLRDPQIEWHRLHMHEQRLLNHFDSILAEGDKAIWAVASGLKSTEEGQWFAGAFVLGGLGSTAAMDRLESVFSTMDSVLETGLYEGLKHHSNQALVIRTMGWLTGADPRKQRVAARLAGYQRHRCENEMEHLLASEDVDLLGVTCESVRKLYVKNLLPRLESLLSTTADKVSQRELFLACLMMGSNRARDLLRRRARSGASDDIDLSIFLAMCGNQSDIGLLIEQVQLRSSSASVLTALGIMGHVDGIQVLLRALQSAEHRTYLTARRAFLLITGPILPQSFVDTGDGVDAVTPGLGDYCAKWWQENRAKFDPSCRWRKGKPFSFEAVIEELASTNSYFENREQAYWELVIRSGNNVTFEADWFVAKQKKALLLWQAWWDSNQSKFAPGKWYFNGHLR